MKEREQNRERGNERERERIVIDDDK